MAKPFINIKELAKALNLSTSTVSRAFRDKADIKASTKQFILDKAKELGYYPNLYASNLRDSKSRTIAIIMPELANNFFSLAVKGIEKIAQSNGYHTLIYVTDSSYEKEVEIVDSLYNGRVEGIIMSVSGEGNDHHYIQKLKTKKIPLVFFDRVYDDIDVPKVTTDDYYSSFRATEYLLKNGNRRIAFLVIDRTVSIGNARMSGYIDAHKEFKAELNEGLIIDCSNNLYESHKIIKKMFATHSPDAVLASVERLATTTYAVCLEEKIKIPDQVKVLSYSNLPIAALLNPSLSTIEQPAEMLGTKAAEIMFDILKGNTLLQKDYVLKSQMHLRTSTARKV